MGSSWGPLRQHVSLKTRNPEVNPRRKGVTGCTDPVCRLGRLEKGSRKLLRLAQPGGSCRGKCVRLSLGRLWREAWLGLSKQLRGNMGANLVEALNLQAWTQLLGLTPVSGWLDSEWN